MNTAIQITPKLNDPVADLKLVDAYFRWALLSIVEVAGEHGLDSVLERVGMERFRQSYASDKLEPVSGLTYGDFATINQGVIQVIGAKQPEYIFHSGRVSARHAMRQNGSIFHPSTQLISGQLDQVERIELSLETVLAGYKGVARNADLPYHAWLEETGEHFYYHLESCAVCAGKSSSEPICQFFSGSLMESLKWFTGQKYTVEEIACRAMNDPACVWRIDKQPAE